MGKLADPWINSIAVWVEICLKSARLISWAEPMCPFVKWIRTSVSKSMSAEPSQVIDDFDNRTFVRFFRTEKSMFFRLDFMPRGRRNDAPFEPAPLQEIHPLPAIQSLKAVSYTHLTLPTIYSV